MKHLTRTMSWLAAAALVVAGCPWSSQAKGYSGSHGHSYSSSSSSHSFGSGGSHSFGSSSGHSSGSGNKSFGSGGGKSYSSGSTWKNDNRHGYSSGKSYSSGGGLFGSGSSGDREGRRASPAVAPRQAQPQPHSQPGGLSFDTAAARAKQQEASRRDFNRFNEGQSRTPSEASSARGYSYQGKPPPIIRRDNAYRQPVLVPDTQVIVTRPGRVRRIFGPYYTRPVVIYQDSYSNLFWWWLLDRSLEDRAWWAYHHRYDMDPARYQALVANDRQLEERVEQLEAQQTPRNPGFAPTGLDRDLMYSDRFVATAYSNRPTALGVAAFWVLGIPLAATLCAFFIWLIWFKRWQPAT